MLLHLENVYNLSIVSPFSQRFKCLAARVWTRIHLETRELILEPFISLYIVLDSCKRQRNCVERAGLRGGQQTARFKGDGGRLMRRGEAAGRHHEGVGGKAINTCEYICTVRRAM